MTKMRKITAEQVKRVLDYNPETGAFTWKSRTPDMFCGLKRSPEYCCNLWNAQWAGKPANKVGKQSGYVIIKLDAPYYAHLLAWAYVYGERPTDAFVDHINGNKLDNRICNLRLASKAENGMNRGKQANNTSGYKGVSWSKACGKWTAHIKIAQKKIHLGTFESIEAAASAYNAAALRLHGEFAKTNAEACYA